MRRFLLSFLPCVAFTAIAGVTTPPSNVIYEEGVYGLKLSPNGKWLGSMAGDAMVYNMETRELTDYWGTFLGLGNAVANNGMAVGDMTDHAMILYQGQYISPESLKNFLFCDINAITAEGTRIAGTCGNSAGDGVGYIAFVADIDENGNVGEPILLPYPKEDFFRAAPQMATGNWISDDGKTVIGQMVDWRGMYTVPIYYTEDENGKWSYSLPTESLFNPTGIELPDNPWLAEPFLPEPEDCMSNPVLKEAYLNEYDQWIANGCVTPQPDFTAFMTDDDYQRYADAVNAYNDWYYSVEDKIKEYVPIYLDVLKTSPSFSANDAALARDGSFFIVPGGVEDEAGENTLRNLYKITIPTNEMVRIATPEPSLYPCQMLADGTVILTRPIMATPDSYIIPAGTSDVIKIEDYLRPTNPEVVNWIEENFPGGSGVILFSDDMSVMTGALTPGQLANYGDDDYYYNTYIVKDVVPAGVEAIEISPENGVYNVHNLQGVKVLTTKDQSEINNLGKGIYIVNGKKVLVK